MCREYAGKELQGLWIVAVILICLVKFSQVLFLFHFLLSHFCGEIKLCVLHGLLVPLQQIAEP